MGSVGCSAERRRPLPGPGLLCQPCGGHPLLVRKSSVSYPSVLCECPVRRAERGVTYCTRLGAAAAARSCGQLRTSQNSSATRIRNHTTHVHKMVTRERGGEKDRVVVNGRGAAMNVWGGGGRQAVASGVVGRRCARVFGELA